jgi:hypothetical protein
MGWRETKKKNKKKKKASDWGRKINSSVSRQAQGDDDDTFWSLHTQSEAIQNLPFFRNGVGRFIDVFG